MSIVFAILELIGGFILTKIIKNSIPSFVESVKEFFISIPMFFINWFMCSAINKLFLKIMNFIPVYIPFMKYRVFKVIGVVILWYIIVSILSPIYSKIENIMMKKKGYSFSAFSEICPIVIWWIYSIYCVIANK